MYLLDTNACIRLLNGTSPALVARIADSDPAQIALCSVVKAELLFGARRNSRRADNLRLLESFFEPLASLPFDDACAERYGVIRSELELAGTPIGPNDLMIAATALAHGATLVTKNVKEFSRVAGLRLEDWER
ncbi:MAG: VapC toxin family PIN domain ribonuclease [Holophagae bacterium]|nr:MAG: VapC toxin family PIN domain ribonuclease [Holophagae bacterium]